MLGIVGCGLIPMSGSGSTLLSEVKTDVDCWFKISAFTLASLYAIPPRLNGATSQDSVRLLLIKLHRVD
jgi:hypothetical protein